MSTDKAATVAASGQGAALPEDALVRAHRRAGARRGAGGQLAVPTETVLPFASGPDAPERESMPRPPVAVRTDVRRAPWRPPALGDARRSDARGRRCGTIGSDGGRQPARAAAATRPLGDRAHGLLRSQPTGVDPGGRPGRHPRPCRVGRSRSAARWHPEGCPGAAQRRSGTGSTRRRAATRPGRLRTTPWSAASPSTTTSPAFPATATMSYLVVGWWSDPHARPAARSLQASARASTTYCGAPPTASAGPPRRGSHHAVSDGPDARRWSTARSSASPPTASARTASRRPTSSSWRSAAPASVPSPRCSPKVAPPSATPPSG